MTWPIALSIDLIKPTGKRLQANFEFVKYIPDRWWKWNDLKYMIWNTSYFPSHVTCLKLWSRQSIVTGIWQLKFRYCKKKNNWKGESEVPEFFFLLKTQTPLNKLFNAQIRNTQSTANCNDKIRKRTDSKLHDREKTDLKLSPRRKHTSARACSGPRLEY